MVRFDAKDRFEGVERVLAASRDFQGEPERAAGGQVVGTVANRRLEQGEGLFRRDRRKLGRGAQALGDQGQGDAQVALGALSAPPRSSAPSGSPPGANSPGRPDSPRGRSRAESPASRGMRWSVAAVWGMFVTA